MEELMTLEDYPITLEQGTVSACSGQVTFTV